MGNKTDVWQGTLALMILKTLETMGPQHGYGIARRIEQTSGHLLLVNYGTLYPALLKLEQEGYITSAWGVSDNNRRAKFYQLTRAGKKQVATRSARLGADAPRSSRASWRLTKPPRTPWHPCARGCSRRRTVRPAAGGSRPRRRTRTSTSTRTSRTTSAPAWRATRPADRRRSSSAEWT